MYWVSSFFLKENKAPEFQKWLLSKDAKDIFAKIQEEVGFKYLETYFTILGIGDYDCEDWWEVENWAVFDKLRGSKAVDALFAIYFEHDFIDNSRTGQNRMLRTSGDVEIYDPDAE
jgi:hypothetical protein